MASGILGFLGGAFRFVISLISDWIGLIWTFAGLFALAEFFHFTTVFEPKGEIRTFALFFGVMLTGVGAAKLLSHRVSHFNGMAWSIIMLSIAGMVLFLATLEPDYVHDFAWLSDEHDLLVVRLMMGAMALLLIFYAVMTMRSAILGRKKEKTHA